MVRKSKGALPRPGVPREGDERYLVEIIRSKDVEALARAEGWEPDEDCGPLSYCDPNDAASYEIFRELDPALARAREFTLSGESFWGATRVDLQRFERILDMRPSWERQKTWEVSDSIVIEEIGR